MFKERDVWATRPNQLIQKSKRDFLINIFYPCDACHLPDLSEKKNSLCLELTSCNVFFSLLSLAIPDFYY